MNDSERCQELIGMDISVKEGLNKNLFCVVEKMLLAGTFFEGKKEIHYVQDSYEKLF